VCQRIGFLRRNWDHPLMPPGVVRRKAHVSALECQSVALLALISGNNTSPSQSGFHIAMPAAQLTITTQSSTSYCAL
jgi:hypothetical protein